MSIALTALKLPSRVLMISQGISRVRTCWNNPVPPAWTVLLALIVVQTGFGLYPVVVKKFNASSNPLIFSLYRDALAFPVLLLCALIAEKQLKIPKLRELPVFVLLGVLGMFGNQLLYILGVYHVGPNISSVFQQLIPIWGSILAVVTCTEKIPPANKLFTWFKLFGILVAAGGAMEMILTGGIVVKDNDGHSQWYTILGYLFLLGNTLCMGLYVLLQKKLVFMKNSPWATLPVSVTTWCYLFGALSMGLASIYYCTQPEVFRLPVQAAYTLVFAILVTSSLCYLLITWSNQHMQATIVTAFWPFQCLPSILLMGMAKVPVTVISSYFITEDKLKPLQYIGAALIIVGLCLVVWSNHQEERYRKSQTQNGIQAKPELGSAGDDGDSYIDSKKHEKYKLLN